MLFQDADLSFFLGNMNDVVNNAYKESCPPLTILFSIMHDVSEVLQWCLNYQMLRGE